MYPGHNNSLTVGPVSGQHVTPMHEIPTQTHVPVTNTEYITLTDISEQSYWLSLRASTYMLLRSSLLITHDSASCCHGGKPPNLAPPPDDACRGSADSKAASSFSLSLACIVSTYIKTSQSCMG